MAKERNTEVVDSPEQLLKYTYLAMICDRRYDDEDNCDCFVIFRWEDAKGAYLKFINKLIMGHIEIFSYTNTHIHPITHNHSL